MSNYAFEGQIIKLSSKDFEMWSGKFRYLNLIEELEELDMEFEARLRDGRKVNNWFSECVPRLNGRNKRAQRFGGVEVSKVSQIPVEQIVQAYNEILPELDQVEISLFKGSSREALLAQRWYQSEKHQSVGFWVRYFTALRNHPFYLGQNDSGWKPTIDWLLDLDNFIRMVEMFISHNKNNKPNIRAVQ